MRTRLPPQAHVLAPWPGLAQPYWGTLLVYLLPLHFPGEGEARFGIKCQKTKLLWASRYCYGFQGARI
jgi:hypothetical protein